VRTQADVFELLNKLASLNSPQTDLSDERTKTLWDADDNVLLRDAAVDRYASKEDASKDESKDALYVIVRHFTTDGFGLHVGLASPVRKRPGGELHEYRLPAATLSTEHVGVYVYNPGVYANGTLRFAVQHMQNVQHVQHKQHMQNVYSVAVPQDACPVVHTLAVSDMQRATTVVLTEETRRYAISLRFCFVHDEQSQKNKKIERPKNKKMTK